MDSRLRVLIGSTVGLLPVRVRGRVAKGARWTLYPWTSYWRGTHEPALQEAVSRLGSGDIRGWSCWDLGAHFGIYSVGLSMRVGPTGQVAAFEPNPASFSRLERHRRMNGLTWMKTFPAAASDRTGDAELLTYGELDSTDAHLRYDGESATGRDTPIAIRSVRLDDLVEVGDIRPPQFVKMDVEGHGHRALEGMKGAIARYRPALIVALHSSQEITGVLGLLGTLGYRCAPIGPPERDPRIIIEGDYFFSP